MPAMARRVLDRLYDASAALAALFLVGIVVLVVLQVGANLIDRLAALLTGQAIGLVIPSYADFAGFFLAAASFLALAQTLRHGAHIRVTLMLGRLSGPARRVVELWCLGAAGAMSGFFTWHVGGLIVESLTYNDLSPGMIAVPLWIPQGALGIGLAVLTLSLIDGFVGVLRGADPETFQ